MTQEAVAVGRVGRMRQHGGRGWLALACAALGLCVGATAQAGTDEDWPMWRYDAARTAATPMELTDELHLQWVRELPEPRRAWPHQWDDQGRLDFDISYTPVVKGGRLFVPSNVTDSVTAYDIENGDELWRFHADGPVRLAPVAWEERVYFSSDDGHLYCVDAASGELEWKFRSGPSNHRLLGNERIINVWAVRGGPVLKDGSVYFAAGVWPMHGIFVYSLDAESGEVEWVNDTISSDYVRVPRGRTYGGLAPQGYVAANADRLVVAGGRGGPAFIDRETGEVADTDFRVGKPDGDYAVHAIDEGGMGKQVNEMLAERVEALADQIDGEVFYKLAARDRLFVTTKDGRLYCFGPEQVEPQRYEHAPETFEPGGDAWADVADELLDTLGEPGGYALMLGAGSGDLLAELIARSEMHVTVAESDAAKVAELRAALVEADIYGRRAAVVEADPATFEVQPYLFSLVVSEDAAAAGIEANPAVLETKLNLLRPYGGLAWLGSGEADAAALAEAAAAGEVDQVSVEAGENHVRATRGGPLTGAGQWTHQYHDAANTLLSRDERVRMPVGVLWYGGPNNHNVLPRHTRGPRPQVAGGRQVFLGVETIAARCVYTGRALWEREFAGIGHPFTSLSHEEQWREGEEVYTPNIPGVSYIGSPFVTLPDSVYLRHEGRIYRLDPATGETLREIYPPGRPVAEIYGDEDAPEWGHVSVQGDYLIATSEPHVFEDQELGQRGSYSGTSSRRLAVMDRISGEVLWNREANIGFRHNTIISSGDTLYVIDGLSEEAVAHLARRGEEPEDASQVLALELSTGEERWTTDSNVYGTFLLYSAEHDMLIEGGNQDLRSLGHGPEDEPQDITARRGSDGEILWERAEFNLPAAVRGDMLISASRHDRTAISLKTGEQWQREQPLLGLTARWRYSATKNCDSFNASEHLLLFRTTVAGFYDLEHDTGTGFFSGFRSGCTANMIAAEGVLNALDYTRSCTCSYPLQTSLAMVPMPGDPNLEFWTRYDGDPPHPREHGVNFGAPGRRVDESGMVWHDRSGTDRRHASAVARGANGEGLEWVAASVREGEGSIEIEDLLAERYTLRLHFAELSSEVTEGERVFHVRINGETVLSGFDIVAAAGGPQRATVHEIEVDLEGVLELELRSADGSELEPVISGVELLSHER